MPTPQGMLRHLPRAGALAAALGLLAVAPASAKMYISSSVTTDADGHREGYVEGYAYTFGQANDHNFKLDVVRGGTTVATATGLGYAWISGMEPQAGDTLTLTDTDTSEAQSTVVTGQPTLAASVCGTPTAFSGTRDAGATVYVSGWIYYGAYDARNDYLDPITAGYGAGTTYSGSFPKALSPTWKVSGRPLA